MCDVLYNPENHVLLLVNNLKVKGDQFIVDVGMGYPQFVPVPLDFQDESPVYAQSFNVYKFVQKGGEIIKYHAKNASSLRKKGLDNISEDDWGYRYTLSDLTPKDLAFLDNGMDKIYTDLESILSPFHLSLRATAFCGSNLRAVSFKDSSLLLEDEHHCLEEVKLKSAEELLEKVRLYFPILYNDAKGAIKQLEGHLTF